MTKEHKKDISRLLPERHPVPDFFVCDIFDAVPKSDTASMEFPLFTLSTKPDTNPREYHRGDRWVKLTPSAYGLATVHDRDVLIYCISQCMAAINQDRRITKKMRIQAYDLLIVTNRKTSGEGYKLLQAALRRLQGTQIETNITTGGIEEWNVFSWIDDAKVIKNTRDGRMLELEITLSDWLFNALQATGGDILTISRDYFRLRKPLERRLYELARKHCGTKNKEWSFKVSSLHERTGSTSTPREFKRMLNAILDDCDHIPDYSFERMGDTILIRPKPEFHDRMSGQSTLPFHEVHLKPRTFETAKKLAKGWDVYHIESEWRSMIVDKAEMPENPDASYIGYVKWFVRQHGSAR